MQLPQGCTKSNTAQKKLNILKNAALLLLLVISITVLAQKCSGIKLKNYEYINTQVQNRPQNTSTDLHYGTPCLNISDQLSEYNYRHSVLQLFSVV